MEDSPEWRYVVLQFMRGAYRVPDFVKICRDYAKHSKLHFEDDEAYFARHAAGDAAPEWHEDHGDEREAGSDESVDDW